jgi:hypothetical protein
MRRHFHREKPPAKLPAGPKPILEMVQLPIFRVHYRRLEEYLAKVYRMEGFDFLLASGAVPGLVPEYAVAATMPPAQDAHDRADAIRSGRRTRDVALILNVLCLDGFIPAGRYIIDTRPEPSPIEHYKALLRKTGSPLSAECIAFRDAHQQDGAFTRFATEIDAAVLDALREQAT